MFSRRIIARLIALSLLFPSITLAAAPQESPDLHKAFFLEKQRADFAAARALYESVLADAPDDQTRLIAQTGADRCRDRLAADDFATIMPDSAVFYLELNRPGDLFRKLADLVGLTTDSMRPLLDQRPDAKSAAFFHVPQQIALSPSIFDALSEFGGAAAAITEFDPSGATRPEFVVALHHGDAKMLKGLLETAFQFSPIAEKLHGLPTFSVQIPEFGLLAGVLTESLLITGTSRELVQGVVDRLTGGGENALSDSDSLKQVEAQRAGSTFFAYANLQEAIKTLAKLPKNDQREMAVADPFVDLDGLRWAALSMGIHDQRIGAQFTLKLAEEHRSIVFNLLRLPAMTRQSLACVPAGAAGFFGIGLNPALVQAAADRVQGDAPTAITGLDIGRELFGNIRELSFFAMPGEMIRAGHDEIPPIGLVMAVNDPAKSRALWDQLLSLPGMFEGAASVKPMRVEIGSTPASAYAIPELGKIYLAEMDGCIAIGISRDVIKACINARTKKNSVLTDPQLAPALAALPADSSMMFVACAGRIARMAAESGDMDPGQAIAIRNAAELCSQTLIWAGIGQSSNQLTIQFAATGLPQVNDALQRFAPMINLLVGAASQEISMIDKPEPPQPLETPTPPDPPEPPAKPKRPAARSAQ